MRLLWHSCEKCWNHAKIVPGGAVASASLARSVPMFRAYAGETKGSPLHNGGQYKRDEVALGRQQRVSGGPLRDWSVLTGGLPVARLRSHALDVALRWALGVVATYCRNSAVK